MDEPGRERLDIARRVRSHADGVAASVTEEFLRRHPDWLTRYGERARARGIEDARYHLEFLAAALDAQSVDAFAGYARWASRVLAARGIAPVFLAENLGQLRDHLVHALSPRDGGIVASFVAAGVAACTAEGVVSAPAPRDGVAVFVSALLAGQRKAAATVAQEALRDGASLLSVYADLLQAALEEIGRRWEANEITVADEHMATAIVQYVMAQVYDRVPMPRPVRGRMVVGGVAGELHQLGANMIADVLEAHGWNVRFLGTNVPRPAILAAIEQHRADAVGLSLTILTNLPELCDVINAIRQRFGSAGPRIVVGGRAFRTTAALWQQCEADVYAADVRDAVERLCRPE